MQGSAAALRLRHSAGELRDGGGLLLLRRLWDRLGLGGATDAQSGWLSGQYWLNLLVELWVVLRLYGGSSIDDLLCWANAHPSTLRLEGGTESHHLRALAAARRSAAGAPARCDTLEGGAGALGGARVPHPDILVQLLCGSYWGGVPRKSRIAEKQDFVMFVEVEAGSKLEELRRLRGSVGRTSIASVVRNGIEVGDAQRLRRLEEQDQQSKQQMAEQVLNPRR